MWGSPKWQGLAACKVRQWSIKESAESVLGLNIFLRFYGVSCLSGMQRSCVEKRVICLLFLLFFNIDETIWWDFIKNKYKTKVFLGTGERSTMPGRQNIDHPLSGTSSNHSARGLAVVLEMWGSSLVLSWQNQYVCVCWCWRLDFRWLFRFLKLNDLLTTPM